ncbi:MAG: hypothetical protein ACLU0O_09310 [Collinsella sp.]
MATGFHECNGSLYWFNSSGAMATGWVLDGGTWYYATAPARARGPYPSAACPTASTPGRGHADGLPD